MPPIDQCSSVADVTGDANNPLTDRYGRIITYLRLAITDRCNLRCRYCMPEAGVQPISHRDLLRYEELCRLVAICQRLGIGKVRVTGGEPFVRRGCMEFLEQLKGQLSVEQLYVTTNGVETFQYLDRLAACRIDGINLSVDSLDRARFQSITRRDRLEQVRQTLFGALQRGIRVKINSVVDEQTRDEEIVELAGLAINHPLTVRFIEKMGFSGDDAAPVDLGLRERLLHLFPEMREYQPAEVTTARLYRLPGYNGLVGLIEGHSRRFCSTCNKIRITPRGILKTCLYDDGVLDLRELMNAGATDGEIAAAVRESIGNRNVDGHETEKQRQRRCRPSMATIGG